MYLLIVEECFFGGIERNLFNLTITALMTLLISLIMRNLYVEFSSAAFFDIALRVPQNVPQKIYEKNVSRASFRLTYTGQ